MGLYTSLSDDFYVNLNLNTEMELPSNRETVLHFFERLQRQYPTMTNFYSRDRGEFVLEEEKEQGHYRWATVDSRRICSGYVNPANAELALGQHALVLDLIPFALSVSSLDCESLNLMYGFDFNYRGNHNELIADALGVPSAFESLAEKYSDKAVAYEPHIQFSIDEDCRTQLRVSVETRTSAYHVKTGEFPQEQLSVYVTARRYGSLREGDSFGDVMTELNELCQEVVENHVASDLLKPIQRAIEIKS